MMLAWVIFLGLPLLALLAVVVFLGDDILSSVEFRERRKPLLAEMRWVILGLVIAASFWIFIGFFLWIHLH